MKKQYSFLTEGPLAFYKKLFNSPDMLSRFVTRTAAGGLVGGSVGGVAGFLYGVKCYKSKDKTLHRMEREIQDPETSDYKRRQLIDAQNMIMSMSDKEYRDFLLMKYYKQGAVIGTTLGSLGGSMLLGH